MEVHTHHTNHENMDVKDYLTLAKELRALGANALEIGAGGIKVNFGPLPPSPVELMEAILDKDDLDEDDLYLSGGGPRRPRGKK